MYCRNKLYGGSFMKKLVIVCSALALMALTACTTVRPVSVTSNPVGTKVGEASGGFLFGVLPVMSADISQMTAAKNGGINNIATVDSKVVSYLGIWQVRTTIVTGE